MKHIKRLKLALGSCNLTMSVVGNLSPVLFLTFRELYGLSFSMMGLLVAVNFTTQLIIDLIFSFFSHRLPMEKAVKSIPLMACAGFLVYGLLPPLIPESGVWFLLLGTVIFSAASGFAEVPISPVIATLPSDNPDRELSAIHSVYAWGVVGVVLLSSLFLFLFGGEMWFFLPLLFLLIPLTGFFLFWGIPIPEIKTPKKASGALHLLKRPTVLLSVAVIFLGGAAECNMGQWCSGYLEGALGIPKILGDVFGTALFSLFLGLGRSLYAKKGKNIRKILLWGSLGCVLCYLLAALSPFPLIGLLASALTGLCASMLWPGNLTEGSSHCPEGGVFIFAILAAGGDLGASLGPQLTGFLADLTANSALVQRALPSLSPEEAGLRLGILAGALFPLTALFLYRILFSIGKKEEIKWTWNK